MTDWREELIGKMADAMLSSKGKNEYHTMMDMTRAALAIAEPVIREQCAEMAEKRACMIDCCEATGTKIATAIRDGNDD